MEVQLHPVAWSGGEAYRVTVGLDKAHRTDVGHAWRAKGDATRWAFASSEVFSADHPTPVYFEATDLDGVRAELTQRFRVVELPQDRLTNRRMHETVVGVLFVLQRLAKRTDAREGFMAGIATAVARAVAADIKPGGDEHFISAFVAELRENIKAARAMGGLGDEFAKALVAMMGMIHGDGSDGGPKH